MKNSRNILVNKKVVKHKREVQMKTHETNIMKTFKSISSKGLFGRIAATVLLMLSFGVAPPLAHAAVSGNATIFNEATVSYVSAAITYTASADVSVTVSTLAANPTVTVDSTAQTVAATANAVYNYTLRSNANGIDTYTLSLASVDAGVSASTDVIAASSTLWGGVVLSSAAGTINVPGGSTTGLANGDTVELDVGGVPNRYTVTITAAGNAESSGVPEVEATLTLAIIGASPAITGGNVAVGDQVGQYAVTTLTQTAGTPTVAGVDGTHTNNLTTTSTATLADNVTQATYTTSAGDGNETITTVNSPNVTILKESQNFTTTSGFVSDGSTTAKPGEVIEYRITITNANATTATTSVFLTDDIPAYTTILTGAYGGNDVSVTFNDASVPSTTTTTHQVAALADQADLAAGTLTVTVGSGAGDASVPTGGTLDALDSAVVLYRVTVQ